MRCSTVILDGLKLYSKNFGTPLEHLFVCLFVYLFVSLFVCLSVSLFVCLSVSLFVCLFVCWDWVSQGSRRYRALYGANN